MTTTHDDVTSVRALSPAQAGMLFHRLLDGRDSTYLEQDRYRLAGPLDAGAFRRAWQNATDRHDALRTTVRWRGHDHPVQTVHARSEIPWREIDLRGLAPGEQAARIAELVERHRHDGLDLATEPPMALTLVRLADEAHELLWTSQHIVLDGWSAALVLREVFARYRESLGGPPADLPKPVPFSHYLSWLDGQDPGTTERFWRDRLSGFDTPVGLRLPHPPPAAQRDGLTRVPFTLDEETSDLLRTVARGRRITVPSVVEGVWALTLSAFSGVRDVVFGAVRSGRLLDLPGADAIVGMMVNTVPVRAMVSPGTPVADWVAALHRDLMRQRAFEHASLADIQGWSDVPRPKALFESLVTVQSLPALGPDDLPSGLSVEAVETLVDSGYETALVVDPARRISGELICRDDAVDADTAAAVVNVFARLLDRIARCPDTPIGALDLLTATDRDVVAAALSAPPPGPEPRPVLELIAEQVEARPAAPAVVWGTDGRLTYGELDALADAWAGELVARGISADQPVAVSFTRSPELVVAMLAVMRAGGAYVPIDPDHPRRRRVDMLADTGARVVLTAESLAPRFAGHTGIDVIPLTLETPPAGGAARLRAHPSSLAYIVYTSGSTGTPKGVTVQHAALNWFVGTAGYALPAPGGVIGMASSPSFDALTFEVWTALAHGATLRVIPHDVLLDPPALGACLARWRVETLYLTAALVEELSRHAPGFAAGLRVLLFGGQAADPAAIGRVRAAAPATRMLQVYGPTETTVWSSYQEVEGGPAEFVPLGRPIARTTEYLLDADLRPVPPGVPGELYVGGEGVVRGYLGRPALTAERFPPDPFTGGRMYRTGDLARLRRDGRLEFLRRVDEQVKIRGFRVEPGEIAAVLKEHPRVDAAVVSVVEDPRRGKVLLAHVVLRDGCVVDDRELHALAAERLPAYMLPAHYVRLDRLPLSVMGKVDRARLPAWEETAPVEETGSPLEESICETLGRVLGVARMGPTQNFFHLGGHSLLAVRAVSALATDLGLECTVRQLFDAPTPRELALVAGEGARHVRQDMPRARPGQPVPLSSGQRRMWMLPQLSPGSAEYNSPVLLELRGPLDRGALEAALSDVLARHAVLRTRIKATADGPVAVTTDDLTVPVTAHDLRKTPDDRRQAEAWRLVRAEVSNGFDLSVDALLRCCLIRMDAEVHLLLLTIHHITYDAVSESIIAADLADRYGRRLAGESSRPEPPPYTYADYSLWEYGRQEAGEHVGELVYWRDRLAGLPAVDLPTDRRRPAIRSGAGGTLEFDVDGETAGALATLGGERGATRFMAFLAAFGLLLSRHCGQDDLPVGSPVDLRDRPELDGMVGFLVNTVVLRLDLSGDPTFRELLDRVRAATLEAYANRHVPFDLVVEEVNPVRDAGRTPLFDVLFQLSPDPETMWELPGLDVSSIRPPRHASNFDLDVELVGRSDGGLDGRILYNTELFDEPTIRAFARRYVKAVELICAAPDLPVSALEPMTAEDREALATLNARMAPPDPATLRLDAMVADLARRTPDAAAVARGADVLTYAELDRRADRLARHLLDRGVRHGDTVGLRAGREPETIVAILGAHKAGAAYLPLEPSDPVERIGLLLHDRRCSAVLTTESDRVPGDFTRATIDLRDAADTVTAPVDPVRPDGHPHDLAYVIFTSGSTGQPKAVGVEHRNISHYAVTAAAEYRLTRRDRVLQCSSFSFDAFVSELWTTFAAGATLVLPETRVLSPADLLRTMADTGTTVADMPTALWHQLCAWLAEEPAARVPDALRLVIIGGEQANAEHLRQWNAAVGTQVRLLNSYGPTETTCAVTLVDLTGRAAEWREVPIGRPLPGTRTYVLDQALHPVPPGVSGELYVAGPQVSRGYLDRPGATATSFLPDPWGGPGERMYRTGDLVRLGGDGQLQVLGRGDDQVKVRGFRVELGEVEGALAAFPGVRSAAAAVHDHSEAGRSLVGYVVAAGSPDPADVLAFLRERLPRHCVPDVVMVLDELPHTRSGKVDRRSLPRPEAAAGPVREERIALTDAERFLAGIWRSVLPVETIGPRDRFFDLGGHSLSLARVGARIRGELGLDVPLPVFYERPTLAEQAAVIERMIGDEIAAMSDSEVSAALGDWLPPVS
ncbi:amino acid adenylation domain-containing protein [Nonomuraea angiospora]|uniref:amino acid adenylation domain-containing protein n=1 Tax=Nonomuraea angiospora TaxID=46172 RepID=UPI0033F0F2AA